MADLDWQPGERDLARQWLTRLLAKLSTSPDYADDCLWIERLLRLPQPQAGEPTEAMVEDELAIRRSYFDTIERLVRLGQKPELDAAEKAEFDKIAYEHSWDGLSCSCGGGWLVGHARGCPEAQAALSLRPVGEGPAHSQPLLVLLGVPARVLEHFKLVGFLEDEPIREANIKLRAAASIDHPMIGHIDADNLEGLPDAAHILRVAEGSLKSGPLSLVMHFPNGVAEVVGARLFHRVAPSNELGAFQATMLEHTCRHLTNISFISCEILFYAHPVQALPAEPGVKALSPAFITSTSDSPEYYVTIKTETLADAQAWHDAVLALATGVK